MNEHISTINWPQATWDPIYVKPSKPILLTSELNISLLAYSNPFCFSSNQIFLYDISGVNVYPWPPLVCTNCQKKTLDLDLSTIEFYVNNTPSTSYSCSPDLIPDDSATSVSFLSTYLDQLTVSYGNTYAISSQTICPFLFKNAQLTAIDLYYQVDSFLFVTLFRFQKANTSLSTINSNIGKLNVYSGYNYKLDNGLLNSLVFEKLEQLALYGTIKTIQANLFTDFGSVDLTFNIISLGNFYHKIGIEWINNLAVGSSCWRTTL
jgi:hypothetical protein